MTSTKNPTGVQRCDAAAEQNGWIRQGGTTGTVTYEKGYKRITLEVSARGIVTWAGSKTHTALGAGKADWAIAHLVS